MTIDLPERPGVPVPTGTIVFKDGTAVLGSAPVEVAEGAIRATLSIASLLAGDHDITASYSGDSRFASSVSPVLIQTVRKADTTTAVSSSVSPSVLGQPVTFVAAVTVIPPGAGAPTGTIDFKDGDTVVQTVPLNAQGQAAFTTASLTPGNHTITAMYSGDASFNGSSASVSQEVHYNFDGFLTPLPGSQYNSGRTVPVKFTLSDFNGASVTTAVADVSVNGGPSLGTAVYDPASGHYQFNVQTDSTWVGSLTITISLDDGTNHSVAVELRAMSK